MKQLIKATVLAAAILTANAANAYGGHRHGHHHRHGHGHAGWIVPFVVGAGAAYIITRPQVVEAAPPVIGPSPYCPPGTGYFGHEWRAYTDQWGRYWNTQVPICR